MQRYKVLVVGHIYWPNGFHAFEYLFNAENDKDAADWNRINRLAGDFTVVRDFALYRYESCPTCGQEVWECVREFSEEGASTFMACMA